MPETIEAYPQRQKRNPRRATKDDEGPRRGWRKLKRDPPKVGKGEKISTKGNIGSVKGAKGPVVSLSYDPRGRAGAGLI